MSSIFNRRAALGVLGASAGAFVLAACVPFQKGHLPHQANLQRLARPHRLLPRRLI